MSKKVLISIIVGLSAVIIYLLINRTANKVSTTRQSTTVEKNNKNVNGEEETQENQAEASGNNDLSQAHPMAGMEAKELTEGEVAEFEEYFEEVEKNWATQIEALFVGEFSLGDDALEKYGDLREAYEEEKMVAFQEFHENMVKKHGDNYSFQATENMETFENKVLSIYQDKIKTLLGDDNYRRYQEVKFDFNERIKAEQDPDKGIILIEL